MMPVVVQFTCRALSSTGHLPFMHYGRKARSLVTPPRQALYWRVVRR
jgi:hypothetical protein